MYLTPTNVLKERCARGWCKIQSQRGPYIYRMEDTRVINNKPHIKLTRVQSSPVMPSAFGSLGFMPSLMVLPKEEEDDLES